MCQTKMTRSFVGLEVFGLTLLRETVRFIDFTVTCFGSNIVMLMPYSKDKTMFDECNHLVLSLKEQASICQTYIIYTIGVVYKTIYIYIYLTVTTQTRYSTNEIWKIPVPYYSNFCSKSHHMRYHRRKKDLVVSHRRTFSWKPVARLSSSGMHWFV